MNVPAGEFETVTGTSDTLDTGPLSDCVAIGASKSVNGQTERMVFHVNGGNLAKDVPGYREMQQFLDGDCTVVVTFGSNWFTQDGQRDVGAMHRWMEGRFVPMLREAPEAIYVQQANEFQLQADGVASGGWPLPEALPAGAVTPGFVQALRAWGQYLSGAREWGWGPLAARKLLQDAGLDQVPLEPPTREEVEAFALVAKLGPMSALEKFNLPLDTAAFNALGAEFTAASKTVDAYLWRASNIYIDSTRSTPPDGAPDLTDVLTDVTAGQLGDGPGLLAEPPPDPNPDPTYWDRQPGPGELDPVDLGRDLPNADALDYDAEAAPPPPERQFEEQFGEFVAGPTPGVL